MLRTDRCQNPDLRMNQAAHLLDIPDMSCAHFSNEYAVPGFKPGADDLRYPHRSIETCRRHKRMIFLFQKRPENKFDTCFSPAACDSDSDQVFPLLQDPLCVPEIHFTDCFLHRPCCKAGEGNPQRQKKREKQDQERRCSSPYAETVCCFSRR